MGNIHSKDVGKKKRFSDMLYIFFIELIRIRHNALKVLHFHFEI